eukprot:Em0065g21a
MRIQVLFNGTPVVVPCGDGKIPVRDLIEKAVQRYKKLPNKSDLEIEVKSIRLKDSDAYVDQDDEVAEALQDNEMVILDISIKGGAEVPPPYIGPQATTSSQSGEGIPPGIPPYPPGFGPSPSQEELRDHLDDPDPRMGGVGGRDPESIHSMVMMSSQDDITDPWHQPHPRASTPPPQLTRDWHSGGNLARDPVLSSQESAIVLLSSKSQDDHTPSLRPDESFNGYSQEDQFHIQPSHSQSDFNYQSDRGRDMPKHGKRDELLSTSGSHGNAPSEDYRTSPRAYRRSFSGVSTTSSTTTAPKDTLSPPRGKRRESKPELRVNESFQGRQDVGGGGGRVGGAQHVGGGIHSERSSVSSTDMGDHAHMHHRDFLEEAMSKRGQDWTHPMAPPNTWRPYMQDFLSTSLPYPNDRYPMDHRFEQRSGYLSLQHKDSLRGRYPGGYVQRPSPRGGQFLSQGVGGEDQHHGMMRSRSHDRALDEEQPHMVQPGHYPQGPYHPRQMFDEGANVDYYLSQPTQSFDRPIPPFPYHQNPMVVMMGGPSGYALSQPISAGMYAGGGGGGGSRHNSGSFGSVDRKARPHFVDRHATLNENDLDPCEEDEEEGKGASRGRSSPFKRDYRTKSIYGNGVVFGKWMERLDNCDMDNDSCNELPQFDEGDASQSQRSPSPSLSDRGVDTNGRAQKGVESEVPVGMEEEDTANIPIVELTRDEDESFGIQLVNYTSPDGKDLGVFVGGLEKGGVAARSGKLSTSDRILACNGMDFTDENMNNEQVEHLLMDMLVKDSRLRMAISRGLPLNIEEPHPQPQQQETPQESRASASHTEQEPVVVNAAPGPTNVLSNTRRIGVKHTIQLIKGQNGLGFGITSRDVSTNSQSPIYVKSINADSPASKDGHLKIGDRLLEVNGTEVTGMSHTEVLQLLRSVSGTVELVVSRQETVEGLEEEEEGETPTSSDSTHPIASTASIGKTLISVEIPLSNNGPAGLGISVHGRSSSKSKGTGGSGIYIKSIMPGGATARDGRLQRNDQIVCIGTIPVLGKSDQEALDILKRALVDASTGENAKLKLVVSRTVGINRKANLSMGGFSQMAALGEVSEEEDDHQRERRALTEVGIDVPQEPGSRGNSQPFAQLSDDHVIRQEIDLSRNSASEEEPSRGTVRIRGEGPPARRGGGASLLSEEHSLKATPSENDCLDLGNGYEHGGNQVLEYSSLSLSLPEQPWSDEVSSLDRHSRHRPYSGISSAGQATPTTTGHTSLQARTRQVSLGDERPIADNDDIDRQSGGAPIRGSSRRNKPERGSGRHPHQSPTHSLDNSVGVYATLPRHTTSHSPRSLTPTNGDTDSLCSFEEGTESSLLNRHNRWRISITKKTKKDYLKDLQQYRVQNSEPELEGGGGGIIRTGSDGCLSNNIESTTEARLLDGVEVGSLLGMVKSSSLESLHNVFKNAIKLDSDDGKHRARGASFSVSSPTDGKSSPALVSIKKSPGPKAKNSTTGSKPGIFNFFKKRKAKKEEKGKKIKHSSISVPVSRASTLLEEVHPMINQDGSSPHEAYLSQQSKEHSISPKRGPSSSYGNDGSNDEDDDESSVLASAAHV